MDFAKVDAFVVINSNKRNSLANIFSVKWGLLSLFYYSLDIEKNLKKLEKVQFD